MRDSKLKGWGELVLAAYRGHVQEVETLLKQNADPNETDNLGRTALIHAAAQGHAKVVKVLIAAGTDIFYSPSTDGRTAMHWAAFYGHRECCITLQEAGGEIDEADNDGHSAQELAMLGCADFFLFPADNPLSIDALIKENARRLQEEQEAADAQQESNTGSEAQPGTAEDKFKVSERATEPGTKERPPKTGSSSTLAAASPSRRANRSPLAATSPTRRVNTGASAARSGTASPLPGKKGPRTAGNLPAAAGKTGENSAKNSPLPKSSPLPRKK
jgi:hypothetical protein